MNTYQPRTVDYLSFLYTIGYFGILVLAFLRPFPAENRDVLNVLLGILSMVMVKIVEAFFNKDSANSATATAIRAMSSTPDPTLDSPLIPKSPGALHTDEVKIDATTATVNTPAAKPITPGVPLK